MSETATLLPDVPRPLQRYNVTVTMPHEGRDALVPPERLAAIELAAAAVYAEGLLTAWTYLQTVIVMTVELPYGADPLAAGAALAKALGCESRASVSAEVAARDGR